VTDKELPCGDFFVGLDLGTSGLKAVAADGEGDLIAFAGAGYPTSRPAPGAAEQDPADWIAAVRTALAALAADAPPSRWRAIGLSGMIPTLVTTDAHGEPTGPAITWEDSRAEIEADRLRTQISLDSERDGGEALYRLTGQWVDGRYLLPMFARLASDDRHRAAATADLLGAKDYLFGWLTGQAVTDPSTATGFGCYDLRTGEWDGDVLRAAAVLVRGDVPVPPVSAGAFGGLPSLPPVWPSASTRTLLPELAAAFGCGEIPVCVGAADSVLGALGLGADTAGQIAYVAGTSTVVLGIADRLMLDPWHRFLVTPLAQPGLWGLEMDLLTTGSSLRWLAGLFGDDLDEAAVLALAAQLDPADAPVVLPYLSPGEQGALWDPVLTGSVTGLTLRHDRRHLARGLVNGIVLESRRCVTVLDETASFPSELLVAGGSAASASFRADLADATGRPVVLPAGQDAAFSALGAARLAAESAVQLAAESARQPAVQSGPEHRAGDRALARKPSQRAVTSVIEPDLRKTAVWDALWDAHEQARLRTASRLRRAGSLTKVRECSKSRSRSSAGSTGQSRRASARWMSNTFPATARWDCPGCCGRLIRRDQKCASCAPGWRSIPVT
jgi:xylulokinase